MAITFDLDGLQRDPFASEPTSSQRDALRDVAAHVVLPRILEWLESLDIRATFFSIGEDIERHPSAYRALAAAGHEVANHTMSHLRDFSRQPKAIVRREIQHAEAIIRSATGEQPTGFRAPGYTVTPVVIETLAELGYSYDASMVPSWFYSALKHAFRMMPAGSYRHYLFPQGFGCAAAPRLPYPIAADHIYRPSPASPLTEIPVSTFGALQVPFIHGLMVRLPDWWHERVEGVLLKRPFFTLAFHDLEFADRADFGSLPISQMTAPHVRESIDHRLAHLSRLIARIRQTHRFGTLRDYAAEMRGAVHDCAAST